MPTSSESFAYNYYPITSLSTSVTILLSLLATAIAISGIAILVLNTRHPDAVKKKIIGALCIVIGLCLGAFVFYKDNSWHWYSPIFSSRAMLYALWQNYKISYIEPSSGRTFDTQNNNDTTSEGESYTMLRAVWMDDQTTFDQSWQWTEANLQHSNDHLFSWLYGEKPNGTYGVLVSQNGENSASDADTDIALALVFAYSRWQNPSYLQSALAIIPNIWKYDVFVADGQPYLGASDLADEPAPQEIVDPSYFDPSAYRIFAPLDPEQDWNGLINTSYQVLENSMASPLDGSSSVGLPPDWILINTATGALSAPVGSSAQTTQFGYDAIRVPWRIALDWEWYRDPRDLTVLQNMSFLGTTWADQQSLGAIYGHDGTVVGDYQSPATYGGVMGYFMAADPDAASQVYVEKLQSLYNPDTETWKIPLSYYDANITWFGMALYNGTLPNLFTLNK